METVLKYILQTSVLYLFQSIRLEANNWLISKCNKIEVGLKVESENLSFFTTNCKLIYWHVLDNLTFIAFPGNWPKKRLLKKKSGHFYLLYTAPFEEAPILII